MFGREPTLIMGAVGALIALGIGFGLHITPTQFGLIMAAVSAVLALVVRSQTVPTEKANSQIQVAIKSPPTATVDQVIKAEAAK